MRETELKAYYYPEEMEMIKEVEKKIEEETGKKWKIEEIRDRFYDTHELKLKREGIDLRCRERGEKVILTYKGPIDRKTGFKVREEIEVEVKNEEKIRKILKKIGFEVIRMITKTRKTIKDDAIMITVDYFTRLGVVIELEGKPEQIKEFVKKVPELSKRLAPYSFKDVLKMYRKHRKNSKKNKQKQEKVKKN